MTTFANDAPLVDTERFSTMLTQVSGVRCGLAEFPDFLDTPFVELGLDSLAVIETGALVARTLSVRLPEDLLVVEETPRSLIRWINDGPGAPGPVAVVTTWTDVVDPATLPSAVDADGLLDRGLLHSTRHPGTHVELAWWASTEAHGAAPRDPSGTAVPPAEVRLYTDTGFGTSRSAGPCGIVAVTRFTVRGEGSVPEFREAFDAHALVMRDKPGFLGHRLLVAGDEPTALMNIGWWRSREDYLAVVKTPEFAADAGRMAGLAEVAGDALVPAAGTSAA